MIRSGKNKTVHDRCGKVHVRSSHIMSYQEKINSGQVEKGRSGHFKFR